MFVNILFCSSQLMHVEVKPSLGLPFFCTFVYGATSKQTHIELFHHLEQLRNTCNGP